MIEVENITKWYGPTLAVDNLSFTIQPGEVVGYLGPNGAGKSTTLKIATGYLPPTSGRARVDGHDVLRDAEAARAKIGYLPETTPLYPEMRVDEYLHFRGKLYGMDRKSRRQRIDELTVRCGLTTIRRRVIGHLSKGNRQRVGLAQALLHNPKVLILDEPTAGLDPIQIVEIRHFLTELRDQHAILLSTHILSEIERIADRVMILRQGKLVADGTVDELCGQARGGARIVIDVKMNPVAVKGDLATLPGVAGVETSSRDGWCEAVITPNGGDDPREALLQLVAEKNWPVRSVTRRHTSLEDFYLQIFHESERETKQPA